ncbi:hypothetical protein K470DRAFT_215431 [Piedraia hortae CBS 480.64]|uniref:coproporphyrinogen oxidase n=1 Tax=Piedraia hortae CBS 480.64 TaxID=1314780 RepID=A0A6A7C2P7_9PEZI|nr:hypothetical protein K470DRAFT_215431 [Piedraia hortae CBS 480.64]
MKPFLRLHRPPPRFLQESQRWTSSKTTPSPSTPSSNLIIASAVGGAFLALSTTLYYTHTPISLESNSSTTLATQDATSRYTSGVTPTSSMRLRMEDFIYRTQHTIVSALEKVDGKKFMIDEWKRPDNGGGGTSCILQDGNVFEKAGVNVSVVYGKLPPKAVKAMRANHRALATQPSSEEGEREFFAAGISLVVHPKNPFVPTVHLNYRYFETVGPEGEVAWWFGGGSDLTPSYVFDEDVVLFHGELKKACEKHDRGYYPRFKRWCDEYFYLPHRGERRGVGGIFFDDLDGSEEEGKKDKEEIFAFIKDCAAAFLPAYIPIVEKRKDWTFTEREKVWQQIRRGRYVEFNLVHDRGTQFGLNTPNARVESILMSLPLTARWEYMHAPQNGSREERLLNVLKTPVEWV